jgi:hypothetical protein
VHFFVGGVEAEESPERWEQGAKVKDLHAPAALLETDVAAPARVSPGATYPVSATIANVGRGDALTVTAVLSVTEGAGLAAGETPTRTIGTLDSFYDDTVTWTLVCTTAVPVTITVTPSGSDENSGRPIPAIDAQPGSAVVEQVTPAYLVTTIEKPAPDDLVAVGGEFEVTAAISNTGQTDALSVTAALSWTSGVELVGGPAVQEVGTVSGESARVVTWTLQCTSTQAVTLTVSPAGTDAGSGEPVPAEVAQVEVEQRPSPYLEASISTPNDGDRFPEGVTFVVSASVSNTGEVTATEVTAAVDVSGGAVVSGTESLTPTVDTLPVGASGHVSWTLTCTQAGWVTVTVAPAGFNEELDEPIPEARLASDTVVLHQMPLIYLPLVARQG